MAAQRRASTGLNGVAFTKSKVGPMLIFLLTTSQSHRVDSYHWPDRNHLHHQHQTDQELDKQRGFPSGPDIEVRACNWEWDCVGV